jgi:predicted tellurium resistance membrane protein TerC
MMDWLVALLTLTAMEIVLGIDNVLFIAIVAGRLPAGLQARARRLGLGLALSARLLLLLALSWLLGLTRPLFALSDLGVPPDWLSRAADEVSWRDLILVAGGLFLVGKSTFEIHGTVEGAGEGPAAREGGGLGWALVQITVLDLVFSLDSVITAVGMARQLWVMVAAMVLAVGVMVACADAIGGFVRRHPTVKVLALSFLILIGVMLVAEGIDQQIQRGYIYFAMVFALVVELLNQRLRKRAAPATSPVTRAARGSPTGPRPAGPRPPRCARPSG